MICAGQVSDRSFEDLQGPLFFFLEQGSHDYDLQQDLYPTCRYLRNGQARW